jgi:nucleotide-binding universal stress UspA family protein/RimJ/RimL family protein N-acetyltransferase
MRTVMLRDGSTLSIRPIEPDDRAAFLEAFRRLSPETRFRRFFAPVDELSERDLDYLTRVDHHDHEALVGFDPETRAVVGVARFVRTGPGVAEPAIVVTDDWQGRGLGSVLLDALVARAREEGIERFEAPVLATNRAAIRTLERLGETKRRRAGREVELTIELPERPAPGRRPARRALREFAAGALEPARTLVGRLRPARRPGAPGAPRRNLIVVGTDGSEHAAAAVEAAGALAAATGAIVHVVAAHRTLMPEREELTAAVRDAAAALRERGLHVHEHVRRGEPALVLASVATDEDARLVVVGAGDHAKLTRRLVGGVADLVAERSPCDVLIVR